MPTLEYQPAAAARRERRRVRVRPLVLLLAVWAPLAMASALFSCQSLVSYTGHSGTYHFPHALAIKGAAATMLGPFAGAIMVGSFSEGFYRWLAAWVVPVLVLGWIGPLLIRRRRVHWALAAGLWLVNFAAAVIWFGSAMFSEMFWLS
jgi:hypothetical protein